MAKWLRNQQLSERYGGVSRRTLERMRRDGRLPPARFPFGNKIPANSEEELDAHDAAVVLAANKRRQPPSWRTSFLAEIGVAERSEIPAVLDRYERWIAALSPADQDDLLTAAQDAVRENTNADSEGESPAQGRAQGHEIPASTSRRERRQPKGKFR
jgi:hypothetical protein